MGHDVCTSETWIVFEDRNLLMVEIFSLLLIGTVMRPLRLADVKVDTVFIHSTLELKWP